MNHKDKYINEIRHLLSESSDEPTKEKILRLTSGSKCIGVTVPKIRQIAKSYKTDNKPDFDLVCDMADSLFVDECREDILFAIFLMSLYKKEFRTVSWDKIDGWLYHVDNWETCDQLSSNIVAPMIVNNPTLTDKLLSLSKSSDKWKRRFAAATVANMNHGGHQYPEETFVVCRNLLSDKEQVVSKAVGWALREIGKKCPQQTFDFLNRNKTIITKKLLKESSELLPGQYKTLLLD